MRKEKKTNQIHRMGYLEKKREMTKKSHWRARKTDQVGLVDQTEKWVVKPCSAKRRYSWIPTVQLGQRSLKDQRGKNKVSCSQGKERKKMIHCG